MKSRTSGKEMAVGCTIAAGVVVILASAVATYMFAAAGVYRGTYTREAVTNKIRDAGTLNLVPLSLTFMAIGVLMVGGALVYSFLHIRSQHSGPRVATPNVRILARFATNSRAEIIAEHEVEFEERPRFYVRAMLPDGNVDEFETAEEVFYQCGEGMSGEALVQGRWLGGFVPYMGHRGIQF